MNKFILDILFLSLISFVSCSDDSVFTKKDYILYNGEIVITSIPDIEEVTVPRTLKVRGNTYDVTGIGALAGSYKKNLKILSLPPSINTIGENAFIGTSIEKLYIEDLSSWCDIDFKYRETYGNTGIQYASDASPFAYGGTTRLYLENEVVETLVIPENVDEIRPFAFQSIDCRNLIIGNSVVEVGPHAFHVSKIEELNMGKSLQVIEREAFSYCKRLKKITLSDNLKRLTDYVFAGCDSINEINSPSLETICYLKVGRTNGAVFGYGIHTLLINGESLNEVVIPFVEASLGDYCLGHTDNIVSIKCEEGIESTGFLSFRKNNSLEEIIFPSTMKKILTDFSGCSKLRNIFLKSIEPPMINGSYWDPGRYIPNCVLYVPAESIDAYKSSPDWGLFKKILPLEEDLPAN